MSSSSSTARSILDRVYLVYFVIHIPILFCVDLVPLYPPSLWVPPSSPLHILSSLRTYYITTYNDQFFLPPPASIPSFFKLFAFLELVIHLPVSVWAVSALTRKNEKGGREGGRLSGSAELLLLVYGFETALTTATCMYDIYLWDPAVVTAAQKTTLLAGLYGGYLALAVILTVDMYARVLGRLNAVDDAAAARKAKKAQ
ncbi:transmembrane protein 6/97 [Astrocystis sublimbata]|nr:transmembrane protein 6/97 [Astrocystis sublimbata]